jgi:hypothetical protein
MSDSDNPENAAYFRCKNYQRCGNEWRSSDHLCSKCRKGKDTYEEEESIVTPSQSISTINDSSSSTKKGYLFNNIGSFVHEYGIKIDAHFQCSKCSKSITGKNGSISK